MSIGQRIKNAREQKSMTLDEVAKRCGTTKQTIFKYENDIVTNIPYDKIVRLAAALDRSKSGNITDVSCDILGDSIIMKTIVKEDATFDIRQGMKVANDFKRVLKKSLQII